MPIKEENKSLYPPPKEWQKIRLRILKRAGEIRDENGKVTQEAKCEKCRAKNHSFISRDKEKGIRKDMFEGMIYNDETGELDYKHSWHLSDWESDHITKIVLTIAHLNHNPSDNRDENLSALCQRCHLALDHNLHRKNSRETRNKKRKQTELDL